MKLIKMFTSFFDRAIGVLGMLGVFILAFLLVLTNYEVVGRYLLNRPAAWSLEIIEYGLLYLTFLGAAWLLKEDEHIKMDIVIELLRPSVRVWVNTITSAIVGAGAARRISSGWSRGHRLGSTRTRGVPHLSRQCAQAPDHIADVLPSEAR